MIYSHSVNAKLDVGHDDPLNSNDVALVNLPAVDVPVVPPPVSVDKAVIDIGAGVNIDQRVDGNILTVAVKKAKGFLLFGFGKENAAGDVFIVENVNNAPKFQSCELNPGAAQVCGNGLWTLDSANLNPDGSWSAVAKRNISVRSSNQVVISRTTNDVRYAYSDSLTQAASTPATTIQGSKSVTLNVLSDPPAPPINTANPFNYNTTNIGLKDQFAGTYQNNAFAKTLFVLMLIPLSLIVHML